MNIKEFLYKVCNEIKYIPIRKSIYEELELHIQDIKENYINNGMQEVEAEEKAISQMGVAEDIGKALNKIHKPKLDWMLLLLILILVGFGMFIAAIKQPLIDEASIGNTVPFAFVAILLCIGIYFFNYKKLKNYSNIIWVIASLIMILPFIPITYITDDAFHIKIFNILFFPPTIALPLYTISFIGYIVDYNKNNIITISIFNKNLSINKDFLKIIMLVTISLLLMIAINSIAYAIILGIIYLVITTVKIVQIRKNTIKKLLILYGLISFLGFSFICISLANDSFRFERVIASFNPEIEPQGTGYVGMLQKEILENSKLVGEASTDVVSDEQSVIIGENNYLFIYLIGKSGILISIILIITIVLTSVRLIFNAKNIKEEYGKFIIIGLCTFYILQFLLTILMNLNLGIKLDINLPFVTFDGISFLVNLLNIALILSIYRRKDITEYENKYDSKNLDMSKKEGIA